jgi:hypothetical protein
VEQTLELNRPHRCRLSSGSRPGRGVNDRLILRKESPPGAQLQFTDSDGLRVTAFITDTGQRCGSRPAWPPGAAASPTRPRGRPHPPTQGHRPAKSTLSPRRGERGLVGNHPGSHRFGRWSKRIGFTDAPDLATCEIGTFRDRVLHIAARITRGADRSACASTLPGYGPLPSPKGGNDFGKPSPNVTPSGRPNRGKVPPVFRRL